MSLQLVFTLLKSHYANVRLLSRAFAKACQKFQFETEKKLLKKNRAPNKPNKCTNAAKCVPCSMEKREAFNKTAKRDTKSLQATGARRRYSLLRKASLRTRMRKKNPLHENVDCGERRRAGIGCSKTSPFKESSFNRCLADGVFLYQRTNRSTILVAAIFARCLSFGRTERAGFGAIRMCAWAQVCMVSEARRAGRLVVC